MIILFSVCTVEGVILALTDQFPNTLRKRKEIFVGVMCVCGFFLGLPMVCQVSSICFMVIYCCFKHSWHVVEWPVLVNFGWCVRGEWCYFAVCSFLRNCCFIVGVWYVNRSVLFFTMFVESIVLGADKIYKALEDMLGFRPCIFWYICWKFTAPLVCTVSF